MASFLNNMFLADENEWLGDVISEDAADLEAPVEAENQRDDAGGDLALPDVIGILPIRNTVAYPGTIIPLAVGRERSKALLADAEPNATAIGLLTQRNADIDKPGFGDLYSIGTTASVLKLIKMPQGSINIFVHGIARFKIVERIASEPYLKARIKVLNVRTRMTKQLQALMVSVRQTANRVVSLSPNVPEEASVLLENIEEPSALADYLAANLSMEIIEKQQLLEELDPVKRLEKVSVVLAHQLEVLELSHKIQGRVRESIDKSQREYFLQEQLKAIQSELGQQDVRTEELREVRQNIAKAKMPKKVDEEALRELDRLGLRIALVGADRRSARNRQGRARAEPGPLRSEEGQEAHSRIPGGAQAQPPG
jgi:ATP-dependent Lon protease